MNVQVEELAVARDDDVAAFLDRLSPNSPSVLGYHYPFYRDMLVALDIGRPMYLGARLGGELVGMLPVFVRQSEVGAVYGSLPFFGPNAGVICASGPQQAEIHAALLGHLLDRAREANALSCSVYTPLRFEEFSLYDRLRPHEVVERFTQYTEVQTAVWNSSIKHDLRRARRLGVTVSSELDPQRLDTFYAIYGKNCADYGMPVKPRRCLELLAQPGVLGRHTQLDFAMRDGQVIAGLLTVRAPATASYYIPCTLREARTLQPGTVLIDKAVQHMRAAGVLTWNWESSPSRDCGVYRYKRKWNSVESAYRIYVWCPAGVEILRKLGPERLAAEFPYFFVYPYDRLSTAGSDRHIVLHDSAPREQRPSVATRGRGR